MNKNKNFIINFYKKTKKNPKIPIFGPKRLKPGKPSKTAKKGLKKAFFGVSLSIW
jgi:hypothetical protein